VKVWIEKPMEPARLFLAWQAPEGQTDRLRWAVGVIDNGPRQTFHYFDADELPLHNAGRGLDRLKVAGFVGYPAFPFEAGRWFDTDILKTFLRRLPPISRGDFNQYQDYFSIRPGSSLSGPVLLALTEARLPSDGFSIVDPLDPEAAECDSVFEIAGYRYEGAGRDLEVGDDLTLKPDPSNAHDPNAVAVYSGSDRVGFVNRIQAPAVGRWLSSRSVTCQVLRKNGRADAPRAYALISVRPRPEYLAA
jgi:hypothetical protein